MVQITATELKTNLGQYLERVLHEDIWITKNGKTVAKLVNPNISAVDSITGLLKGEKDIDMKSIRSERLGGR